MTLKCSKAGCSHRAVNLRQGTWYCRHCDPCLNSIRIQKDRQRLEKQRVNRRLYGVKRFR